MPTLVVRLHHTKSFQQGRFLGPWRYAADFKTLTGKQLGVKLTRRAEGAGELEVYFDPAIPVEEKIIFSRYVHETCCRRGRTSCGCGTTCVPTAARRWATGK